MAARVEAAAAHAIAGGGGGEFLGGAGGLNPIEGGADVGGEAGVGELLHVADALRHVGVAAFKTGAGAVEQFGRDGEVAFGGEAVGYIADVRVDAEDFLEDD